MNNEPVAWMGKDYDGLKTDLYFNVEKTSCHIVYMNQLFHSIPIQ